MSLLRWLCVLALVGTLGMVGACGDDSGGDSDGGAAGDGDGDGDQTPGPAEAMIDAEEGGVLETEGALLSIPGGALSEDTVITVEVILIGDVPDADTLGSLVYDFGPDGTQFEEPVELTIDLNEALPDDMEASIAWLDEDNERWVKLSDSRVEGESVVATTTHFTKFAIVLTASGQTAGACRDFDDFEACGGDDLEGTWELTLACADVTAESLFGEDNPFEMCTGLSVSFAIDIEGTITFDGTSYEQEVTRSGEFGLNIPISCLADVGATCDMFIDEEDMTTASDADGVCEVVMPQAEETTMEMGSFELDGSTIILMDDAEAEADPAREYCVRGDTLTVKLVDVDEETMAETVTYMQATRR